MKRLLAATTILSSILALVTGPASTQERRTLYLGAYGGSIETLMKEKILPEFEEANNVKVEYVAGNSTENLARLQAQAGKQELDVVMLDDGPMYQAIQFGFCGEIVDVPNGEKVYDVARLGKNAIAVGVVGTVIGYNAEMFKENGWAVPTSWLDLANKDFAGKLSIPPISSTYGLHTLVMSARLNGGGESNIDPGFKYLAENVEPNVLAFEASSGRMSEMFQNKEIAISVWGTGRFVALQDTGFPAEFIYPKEGGVAVGATICPVAETEDADLASAFINYLLEPEVQEQLAATQGFGPVNREVKLSEAVAARVPYGEEQVGKLIAVDWNRINKNRQEWTQRWAREIER